MAEKTRLFTIGQFASLHGINKKTLMWYDEVGLFHPAVVKENGYRYYTFFQSAELEAILLLRELDVPLARIRAFLDERSPQALAALLDEQTQALTKKMAQLRQIQKTLIRQAGQARALLQLDPDTVSITSQKPERLILLPTRRELRWEQDTRTLVRELQSRGLGNLYNAGYGAMIPVERLMQGDFWDYRYVFLRLPSARGAQGAHRKPGGQYLTAYYRGNVDDLSARYRELLSLAQARGLRLAGFAYETVLNEMAAPEPAQCLTRIDLPLAAREEAETEGFHGAEL